MKKHNESGFTLVELLTVLAIVTMLIGLMVPSLSMARKFAKETKQKTQLATIGAALTTFRGDYGDYPPSTLIGRYCGAQKLCEAMLGWDLMGFHPNSGWRADGLDINNNPTAYTSTTTLSERKGRYLELATIDSFPVSGPQGLLDPRWTRRLDDDRSVLTDVFRQKKGNVNAGAPILYYRADTAGQTIDAIYNHNDNKELIRAVDMNEDGALGDHPLSDPSGVVFHGRPDLIGYIQDVKVSTNPWPHRPDSYLLVTAGADGLYGTNDDICNFGN